jgi:hypothetical protein
MTRTVHPATTLGEKEESGVVGVRVVVFLYRPRGLAKRGTTAVGCDPPQIKELKLLEGEEAKEDEGEEEEVLNIVDDRPKQY